MEFLKKLVEDPDWIPVLESAVTKCHSKINTKLPEIAKNIKKEDCNVKYEKTVVCFMVEIFTVTSQEMLFCFELNHAY